MSMHTPPDVLLLVAVLAGGCPGSGGMEADRASTTSETDSGLVTTAGSSGGTSGPGTDSTSSAGGSSDATSSGVTDDPSSSGSSGPNTGAGDHESILALAVGFGRNAAGGAGGPVVHVTTLADSGPGSLRDALEAEGAAWVVSDVSGTIDLDGHIDVASDKTLDGRGADLTISGYGLRIREVEHVVVTHMRFDSGTDDAVKVIEGAHDVWINQSSFADFDDGLVDITRGATDVTVSHCHFHTHNAVMLIGASPSEGDLDVNIRVTLHGNYFDDTNQRHPHIRFGRLHAFNNYYRGWGHSGIQYNYEAQVASEANIFEPETDGRAIVHRWEFDMMGNPGAGRSVGDLLLDDATAMEYTPELVFDPAAEYDYEALTATEALAAEIASNAGYQDVPLP